MQRRAYLLALLVLTSSCKSREKDYSGDACPQRLEVSKQRMGEMRKRLRVAEAESVTVPRVAAGKGKALAKGELLITIGASDVRLNGRAVTDLAQMLKRRIELAKSFSPENKSETRPAHILAAGSLPATRLKEVVDEARKYQWEALLLVRAPDYAPIERTTPAWVKELLPSFKKDGFISAPQAKKFKEAIKRSGGSCKHVASLFDSITAKSIDPEQRQEIVGVTMPENVEICACDFDVDAAEALTLERFLPTNIQHRTVTLPNELPEDGTVDELVKRTTSSPE